MLCKLFGHRTILRSDTKYNPGAEYMSVRLETVDGVGRQHAGVYAKCAICGKEFMVGRIHVPKLKGD